MPLVIRLSTRPILELWKDLKAVLANNSKLMLATEFQEIEKYIKHL